MAFLFKDSTSQLMGKRTEEINKLNALIQTLGKLATFKNDPVLIEYVAAVEPTQKAIANMYKSNLENTNPTTTDFLGRKNSNSLKAKTTVVVDKNESEVNAPGLS